MDAEAVGDIGPIHVGKKLERFDEVLDEFVIDDDLVGIGLGSGVNGAVGVDDGGVVVDAGIGGADGDAIEARGAAEGGGISAGEAGLELGWGEGIVEVCFDILGILSVLRGLSWETA